MRLTRPFHGVPVSSSVAGKRNQIDSFFEWSLLGLVVSGYLAVAGSGYIDTPTILLAGLGLLLRGLIAGGFIRMRIPVAAQLSVAIAYMGFYPIDYFFVSKEFLPATVHLVFFLAVFHILTASTMRDFFFVKMIALLEILAATVLSASANFFVFLGLFLLFGIAAFCSSEVRGSASRHTIVHRGGLHLFPSRLMVLTGIITFGVLVMTAGLFFVLPRTARAAFRHLVSEKFHLQGFSNEVRLGQIGELQQQDTPVMHVRFANNRPSQWLKWRGSALAEFDGQRWFNPPGRGELLPVQNGLIKLRQGWERPQTGTQIAYEVQLSGEAADSLFFAGEPELLQIPVPSLYRTSTGGYRLVYRTGEQIRYNAYSFLKDEKSDKEELSAAGRQIYLRLPRVDERVRDLAARSAGAGKDDRQRATLLADHLRTQYAYTLTLPAVQPDDPIAYFLFERRKGHCEYFASSMAVMLRTVGIPSRVVTGFQSGVFNPISGWELIRASDAHSWVEAWIDGAGWVTFDPTPPAVRPLELGIFDRARLYADAAEMFWNEWVLNYDLDRQLQIVTRVDGSNRTWNVNLMERWKGMRFDWKLWLKVFVSFALAVSILLLFTPLVRRWWQRRGQRRRIARGEVRHSDGAVLYCRMLSLLEERGVPRKASTATAAEFARTVPEELGAELVAQFTLSYHELRYGGRREAALRMVELLDRLEAGTSIAQQR
jgi:transglutaminase-like putative cysteine protease